MKEDILEDWEKKSKEHQKLYKNYLQRADKRKVLKLLPDAHEAAFSKINCLDCGRCCKNHSPRFKMPDIKRISKTMGMREVEFIDTYLKMDADGDYVNQRLPCAFLADDNTCNIYEDRPTDCQRYPYTDEDVFIKRPVLTLTNSTVCPAVYYVFEQLLEEKK
jgi:uncharacterized protein